MKLSSKAVSHAFSFSRGVRRAMRLLHSPKVTYATMEAAFVSCFSSVMQVVCFLGEDAQWSMWGRCGIHPPSTAQGSGDGEDFRKLGTNGGYFT